MEDKQGITGHLYALFTSFVWGITFVSTKVLLKDLSAADILFFRFVIGYLTLLVIYPHSFGYEGIKKELTYVMAGILGTTLYQFLENTALSYTQASNASIIISSAPFFTGILSWIIFKNRITKEFLTGFILAMGGIFLINYNGSMVLKLNPKGDILALSGAFVWAMYSMHVKVINERGHNIIASTRRIFLWGIVSSFPIFLIKGSGAEAFLRLAEPVNLLNILFLGILASGICFVTWNTSVKHLGAVKASAYIYLQPFITLVFSVLILHEKLGAIGALGMVFVISGLVISEFFGKKTEKAIDK